MGVKNNYMNTIYNSFREIKIPMIEKNTIIEDQPYLSLKLIATDKDYYDINNIIHRIIQYNTIDKKHCNEFKYQLITEIAYNKALRDQLSGYEIFNEWIIMSKNIKFIKTP